MKKLIENCKLKIVNSRQGRSGFVVLYTVLISSIILAIALGISSISYQEVILSASAKEGNISFFAADTGAECALYLDIKRGASCNGVTISNPASFILNLNNNTNCAKVTITKDQGQTKIESLGYNLPCGQTSARLVERAIRVTY